VYYEQNSTHGERILWNVRTETTFKYTCPCVSKKSLGSTSRKHD